MRSTAPTCSWQRLSLLTGVLTASLGVATLAGWVLGPEHLSALADGRVPMAPSTALLFLLFGVSASLAGSAHPSRHRPLVLALGGVGTLAAVALLLTSSLGLPTDFEHLGMDLSGEVAGVHIGHISPVTAFGFVLTGISLTLAVVSEARWARAAFGLAGLVPLMGVTLTVAYILSRPAFYNSSMIPPALSTSLGFVLLGCALLGVAACRLWPGTTHEKRRPTPVLRLSLGVGLAVVAIVTPTTLLFRQYQADFRAEVEAHQIAIADLKVDQIEGWRSERIRDGIFLNANPVFAELVRRVVNEGDPDARRQLIAWLTPMLSTLEYSRVALVDATGQERLAVPETDVPPGAESDSSAVRRTIRSGTVALHDVYDSTGATDFVLTLIAPILDGAGAALGAVVVTIDPARYLGPLLQSTPTPTETGETLLVRRDGTEVVFLNDVRFRSGSTLALRYPLTQLELPAARAALGGEGIVYGMDYRGEPVVAALRAVPGSEWKLVSRVDIAEVYGPLRSRLIWTVALVALLLVGLVGALALGWQRREKVYYRAMAGAEDRYRTLLRSIGDAVIATDPEGIVELMNPVAEQLTGWTEPEALGRKLDDVFRIVQEETREPVENPVAMVLRHGGIVGLANHTILISREGRECPIADSGAPVRSADGRLVGVVLVFRDRTEEWTARARLEEEVARSQRNEAKYRNLFNSIRDGLLVADTNRAIVDCNPAFTDLLGYGLAEISGHQTSSIYESPEEYQRMGSELRANMESAQFLTTIRYRKKSGEVVSGETNAFYLTGDDGRVIGFIGLIRDVTERLKTEDANRAQLEELRRWHAVMLDREERISQLKTRINTLHRRLGEPGPYEAVEPAPLSKTELR